MIYLDYAAHAPADPAVLERFCDMERRFTANPNSGHAAGRAAREQMACTAEQIASLTGAAPSEVIFTSGATEANNLAIKGIAQASRHIGRHIISTPLEHSSVSGSLTALQERGWEIDLLSISRDGTVAPEEVHELLRPDTVLVALCAVDSELGTVQPVREIAELLAGYPNCRLHVDATQQSKLRTPSEVRTLSSCASPQTACVTLSAMCCTFSSLLSRARTSCPSEQSSHATARPKRPRPITKKDFIAFSLLSTGCV